MLGGAPVTWSSRKKPMVALSSCKATWMMNLVGEIIGKNHEAMTMKIDNMSAINLAKNDITRKKQTHRNEVPLPERASSGWNVESGILQIRESACRYNDEGCAGCIVQEIKNNDECR